MELVRSSRRRRSATAGVRDGRVVVRVPAGMDPVEERRVVARLVARLAARDVPPPVPGIPDRVASRVPGRPGPRGDRWLVAVADDVADRWLDGVRADDVRWSRRMSTRWGSCTVATRRIRIAGRLLDAPDVVVENLLLHELAHLVEHGHGPAFQALVARDPAAAAVEDWLLRRDAMDTRAALARDGLVERG